MVGLLISMTDGANTGPCHGTSSATIDSLEAITCQPFERVLPFPARLVGTTSGSSTHSSRLMGAGGRYLLLPMADFGEAIMKDDIGDEGVQSGSLERLEARAVLLKYDRVATVECTKEEHDHQKRRDHDFAPRKLEGQAVKTRAVLNDRLIVTLHIVENREK